MQELLMKNKIIKLQEGKYFLIMSVLKLSNSYNIIGFSSNDKKNWSTHVESMNISAIQFDSLVFED
jgi:hypothetical protein